MWNRDEVQGKADRLKERVKEEAGKALNDARGFSSRGVPRPREG